MSSQYQTFEERQGRSQFLGLCGDIVQKDQHLPACHHQQSFEKNRLCLVVDTSLQKKHLAVVPQ